MSTENFASYSTMCPKCKINGKLTVVYETFWAADMPLGPDGFDTTAASEYHTEDEVVHCGDCGEEFPLSEVTL